MYSQKKNKWLAFLALALVTAFIMTGCGKGTSTEVSSDVSEETTSGKKTSVDSDILTHSDYYFLHWEQSTKEKIYDGHYRSQLPDVEQFFYDAYYQHLIVEGRTDDLLIDLSSLDRAIGEEAVHYFWTAEGERDGEHFVDKLEDGLANTSYYAFRNDNPKADGVTYAGCQCEVQDGKVKSVLISFAELYKGAFDELKTVYENIDKSVEEIKGLRKSESRYDTLVAIHDYMCKHLTYGSVSLEGEDNSRFTNSDIATPMFGGGNAQGKVVCGGYSRVFHLLCEEFNIPCYTISGMAPNPGQKWEESGHAWNYVQMENGKWYGVDITWDDNYYDAFGELDYTYFLGGTKDGYLTVYQEQSDTTRSWHLPQPQGPMLSEKYNEETSGDYGVIIAWNSPQKLADERYVP